MRHLYIPLLLAISLLIGCTASPPDKAAAKSPAPAAAAQERGANAAAPAPAAVNQPAPPLKKPRIAVTLPDECNTPDGMSLDRQGNIILSCPNINDRKYPGLLMKITPEDRLEKWFVPTPHPESKIAVPCGSAFGADGHLYVADNQASVGPQFAEYKSRLLRIVVENGKPVRCETVVEGFVLANGVAAHGDQIFVTETRFDPKPPEKGPLTSGVYRFRISEFTSAGPIKLMRAGADPHMVFKIVTQSQTNRVGANGIALAPDGTLYVCNFGDASIIEVKFNSAGQSVTSRVLAQGPPMLSTDGIKYDPATGLIYCADLLANAVHSIDSRTGRVITIAQNGNTTGAGGELDRPSEVCLRNGKLYISNIDLPRAGNTFDKPYTISVIDLRK